MKKTTKNHNRPINKWHREIQDRMAEGYTLKVKVNTSFGDFVSQWEGERVRDNMEETADICLSKGRHKLKKIPGETAQDVYKWLLTNGYLIDRDVDSRLVPNQYETE